MDDMPWVWVLAVGGDSLEDLSDFSWPLKGAHVVVLVVVLDVVECASLDLAGVGVFFAAICPRSV